MSIKASRLAVLGGTLAIVATALSIPVAVLADNWWAGSEKSGDCWIPNRQTSYDQCQYPRNGGSYERVQGARQIGGFYVNPTVDGYSGKIPLEYRINGGGWRRTEITLSARSGNYIDFGNGVNNFNFRFPRSDNSPLNAGGYRINFTFNYDLDR